MSKPVFLSHAGDDSAYAKLFADKVLKNGCQLRDSAIFFSSRSADGVDAGDDWMGHLATRLFECTVVIVLVTPALMKSQVSLMELGAGWGSKKLLPVTFVPIAELGVLKNIQVLDAYNPEHLDTVRDALTGKYKVAENTGTTGWQQGRDQFLTELNALPRLTVEPSSPATPTPPSEVSRGNLSEALELMTSVDEEIFKTGMEILSARAKGLNPLASLKEEESEGQLNVREKTNKIKHTILGLPSIPADLKQRVYRWIEDVPSSSTAAIEGNKQEWWVASQRLKAETSELQIELSKYI